jgi:DNA polymerase-3 subunit delta'
MSLRDIFCQDKAIGVLQRSLAADRSAHAYIFAGPEGVGKYKTARGWAKLLLCKSPKTQKGRSQAFVDSCGSCESCTLVEADSHPDYADVYKELLEFTADGKGRKPPVDVPIDVIREFLIQQVSIRPSLSARRVFIIREAEKLNISSQNALLKVLEEPPQYCTIILLCTRLEKLLPTIKSRCQIVRFGPVEEGRIVSHLAGMGLGHEQAVFFARLSQGSLGLACQWAQLELAGVELFHLKRDAVAALARLELIDVLDVAEQFQSHVKEIASGWANLDKATSKTDLNRRAQKTVIQILICALHDTMKLPLIGEKHLVNADQAKQIADLAGRFDPERAAQGISDGYEMLRWIEASVNERLIFERFLLRLVPSAIMTTAW